MYWELLPDLSTEGPPPIIIPTGSFIFNFVEGVVLGTSSDDIEVIQCTINTVIVLSVIVNH